MSILRHTEDGFRGSRHTPINGRNVPLLREEQATPEEVTEARLDDVCPRCGTKNGESPEGRADTTQLTQEDGWCPCGFAY